MKKILVPTDFTPASRDASNYAASLARQFSAELYLLHVYQAPLPASEVPDYWAVAAEEMQEINEGRMNSEIDNLKNAYSINANGIVRMGYKGDTIEEVAKKIKADLVVMGMKETKRNRLLGSTTFKAIRKSEIPVLIIHEGLTYAPIHHIVLAADFAEAGKGSGFGLLPSVLKKFNADLKVLHVQQKSRVVVNNGARSKAQLNQILPGISFSYEEVDEDSVAEGIQKFIQNHPVDLLVMVAHQHNILERLFGTIHTHALSYEARIPLLILENNG